MLIGKKVDKSRPCWFVGASLYGGDQTENFVQEGRWECVLSESYRAKVRSIEVGDRIAIKACYTRKKGLPFDNRGTAVSVMAIKAIGIVIENPKDGIHLKVDWNLLDKPREWYFSTYQKSVWRVEPGTWSNDELINFAFEGKKQNIQRFINDPYWKGRYGSFVDEFEWPAFYEAVADKLLEYRNNRQKLIDIVESLLKKPDTERFVAYLRDKKGEDIVPPKDICPFTFMGIFNRQKDTAERIAIAEILRQFLNVAEPVPQTFNGIPLLAKPNSMFYNFEEGRGENDIDLLWDVFECALEYADTHTENSRTDFVKAFDKATSISGTKWNLTMGLYWIRPWSFLPLDKKTQQYLTIHLNKSFQKDVISANDYLLLCDELDNHFNESDFSVHSFPELSWYAWKQKGKEDKSSSNVKDIVNADDTSPVSQRIKQDPEYTVQSIIDDGCFLTLDKLNKILERLDQKKNLILQGPPGTGKTWLAKRLAYALIGQEATDRVRAVQFHPNLSYEDFVRGWRPNEGGTLALTDGPFMEMVEAAKRNKGDFVLIIEEINRGNPAQIFGEVLTLIERDKRSPEYSLELSYRREKNERVYIPGNLYVIGTMNVADRSLAQMDLALRRRFAFIDLKPELGDAWREFLIRNFGFPKPIVDKIQKRIVDLNDQISKDPRLGTQFCVGHSFVTPSSEIEDAQEWFKQVVETEIGPLLCHYWFDDLDKAQNAKEALLKDL